MSRRRKSEKAELPRHVPREIVERFVLLFGVARFRLRSEPRPEWMRGRKGLTQEHVVGAILLDFLDKPIEEQLAILGPRVREVHELLYGDPTSRVEVERELLDDRETEGFRSNHG